MIGTVGIPNILLGILIALPFIDLRRERRLSRRPVAIVAAIVVVLAMGTLTYKGATAKEALASETIVLVPEWAETAGLRREHGGGGGGRALRRLRLPPVPHLPRARAAAYLGAPELTAIGETGKGETYFQRYVTNPAEFGNTVMQPYAGLGEENLQKIAAFLDASKGPEGVGQP